MIADRDVTIQSKTITKDAEGNKTVAYDDIATIRPISIQPYNSDLARKEYGLEKNVVIKLFCNPHSALVLNNVIQNGTNKYNIVHVADWGRHLEILGELI
jgi:hypothetical protein